MGCRADRGLTEGRHDTQLLQGDQHRRALHRTIVIGVQHQTIFMCPAPPDSLVAQQRVQVNLCAKRGALARGFVTGCCGKYSL